MLQLATLGDLTGRTKPTSFDHSNRTTQGSKECEKDMKSTQVRGKGNDTKIEDIETDARRLMSGDILTRFKFGLFTSSEEDWRRSMDWMGNHARFGGPVS